MLKNINWDSVWSNRLVMCFLGDINFRIIFIGKPVLFIIVHFEWFRSGPVRHRLTNGW